jgi:hypothetical protein
MMADDRDLEDFFAKKSKKKTKGKYTTSSRIAQNVEQLQHAEREREQAHLQPAPEKPALPNPEDEEWNDFQEETVSDLSGLKIQGLKKSTPHSDQPEPVSEQGPVEDDMPLMKEPSKSAGPWQTSSSVSVTQQSEQSTSAPPVSQESGTDQGAVPKYRPGAFRAMKNALQGQTRDSQSRGSRKLPDMSSEEAFPTLQQSVDKSRLGAQQNMGLTSGFEEVKHGTRGAPESVENRTTLELGNKYDALSSHT